MSKPSLFERHVQTGLVTIVSGIMVWVGITVNSSQTAIARLEVNVSALKDQIETNMSDRYRGADAARDFKVRDDLIHDLRTRVRALEDTK